jgi:O-antigen/teichoic acid export membrane protein
MSVKNQIKWIKRDAGYTFWMFTEEAATLAIPRVLLFPLAAYFIGKEQFGVFMTALSIALILGTQPGGGLATGLLKHISDYPEQQRDQFCGTALRMCHLAMVIIVVLGLLVIAVMGVTTLAPWEILNCLVPLIISLYPENQFMLILTESRFRRRFSGRALWSLLRSGGVFICGLVGVWMGGAGGLAWGFVAGNTIAYAVLRIRYRKWYQTSYNSEMASVLKTVWLQVTIAGIIALSGPYLNRVILSAIHSYGDTADLVAATSVTFVFSVPISCLGGLLLSMISNYSSIRQFTARGKTVYLLTLLFGVTVMPLMLNLFGTFITHLMFPKFGESSIGLFGILIWTIPAGTLICFTRPIVIKFAPIRIVPIINGVSMAATLIPAVFLIPSYATRGAAWAILVGCGVTAMLWSIAATCVFLEIPLMKGRCLAK